METFTKRITTLSKVHELTQSDIAKLLGVTQANVYKYEKGISEPPLETVKWYADYFDVSLDYLLGRTDNPTGKMNTTLVKTDKDRMRLYFKEMLTPETEEYGEFRKAVEAIVNDKACPLRLRRR